MAAAATAAIMGDDRATRCVFVSNVPESVHESNVKEMFAFCGLIASMKRQYSPTQQAFGYEIEFEKVRGAQAAMALHGTVLVGQQIAVQLLKATGPMEEDVTRAKTNQFVHEVITAAYHLDRGMDALSTDLLLEKANAAARAAAASTSAKLESEAAFIAPDDPVDLARAERTVHVSRIDHRVTREQITKFFDSCGVITHVIVGVNPTDGMYYALVEFEAPYATRAALGQAGRELLPGMFPAIVKSPAVIVRSDATKPPQLTPAADAGDEAAAAATPPRVLPAGAALLLKRDEEKRQKAEEERKRREEEEARMLNSRSVRREPVRRRRRRSTSSSSSSANSKGSVSSESLRGEEEREKEKKERRRRRSRSRSDSRGRDRDRGRGRSSGGRRDRTRSDSRGRGRDRDRDRDRNDRDRSRDRDRRRRSYSRDRYDRDRYDRYSRRSSPPRRRHRSPTPDRRYRRR